MSANQANFPIAAMVRVPGVSEAGYRAWRCRASSAQATSDAALLKRVRTLHAISHGPYGVPRIQAELWAEGQSVGRKRVARLMREASLSGIGRLKGTRTARRDAEVRPAPVERRHPPFRPGQPVHFGGVRHALRRGRFARADLPLERTSGSRARLYVNRCRGR